MPLYAVWVGPYLELIPNLESIVAKKERCDFFSTDGAMFFSRVLFVIVVVKHLHIFLMEFHLVVPTITLISDGSKLKQKCKLT